MSSWPWATISPCSLRSCQLHFHSRQALDWKLKWFRGAFHHVWTYASFYELFHLYWYTEIRQEVASCLPGLFMKETNLHMITHLSSQPSASPRASTAGTSLSEEPWGNVWAAALGSVCMGKWACTGKSPWGSHFPALSTVFSPSSWAPFVGDPPLLSYRLNHSETVWVYADRWVQFWKGQLGSWIPSDILARCFLADLAYF